MKLKRALCALFATATAGLAVLSASALSPIGNEVTFQNWLTNREDYTFSEPYKASRWYQNFTALEIGDNERNSVLSIAVSQLGYHEGDSEADFDGTNTAGSKNYAEYIRLPVDRNGNNYDGGGDMRNFAWCATFVNWCISQADISHCYGELSCWRWVEWYKSNEMWQDSPAYGGSYAPQPADMIFFNWSGVNTGSSHIGLVLYTDSTYVYTVEGNSRDNNVTVRYYALNSNMIIGYGTPNYNEGTTPTFDYSHSDGMPGGAYVTMVPSYISRTQSTVPLKSTPADGSDNITERIPIGSTVTLIQKEGGYAKVNYEGREGYINAGFLFYMMSTEQVRLTFDANGGKDPPTAQTGRKDASVCLPETIPTREGYTFLGWSTTATDHADSYGAGDTVSLSSDTTLYAIWGNLGTEDDALPETGYESEDLTSETGPSSTEADTRPSAGEDAPADTAADSERMPETVASTAPGQEAGKGDAQLDQKSGCSSMISPAPALVTIATVVIGGIHTRKRKED